MVKKKCLLIVLVSFFAAQVWMIIAGNGCSSSADESVFGGLPAKEEPEYVRKS